MNPMVFECQESRIVLLRAAHIEYVGSLQFAGFNGLPQKPWDGPKLIESRIGTAVLVIDDVLPLQSENSSDRDIILVGHTNLERFALAPDKVCKPVVGNRRQAMPASRCHKQCVKIF